jgi:hypothetical protein
VSREIACPECSETEELTGEESPEGIRITCGRCGTAWLRDEQPQTCATCAGTDLVTRPRALTQYSRGTQLSIVGMSEIVLCRACDRRMVEWSEAGRAVPNTYRSSAQERDARDGGAGDGPGVLMTP